MYAYNVGMYIAKVPNRNSPPSYLLRESYRENGKVKNRTLANLSSLPQPADCYAQPGSPWRITRRC